MHSPQFRTLHNEYPDILPKLHVLIRQTERQRDIYLGLLENLDEKPQL